ncbi:uncharacterized protein HaLaN_10704, partial [Haematococcus lacustris]
MAVQDVSSLEAIEQACTANPLVEAEVVDAATIKYNIATVPSFVFVRGSQVQDQLEGADPAALSDK